jgi:NAD(P)H-dependent flavin oxidoreductase YrpB (nitropropane dioxygenase family)
MDLVDRETIHECVRIAAERVRVVDFFFGWPDAALVDTAHAGGALVSWQIGSPEEARAAKDAGCDLIVVQGIEAGGHIRGRMSLLALLDQVLASSEVPVLAAGGIGTGRAMAAALAAGAAGVRVGTRFIAASESDAHPTYVQALIAAEAGDTIFTERFAGGWPDAPHRVLRSSLQAAEAFDGDVVGERVSPLDATKMPIARFQGNFTVTKLITGAIEAMPLWAGESVGGVKRIQPAGEIVRDLADEAERLLRRWT